jgi:hypothetical protein
MPYELFLLPCTEVEQYYFINPLYQSQLYTLIELRHAISAKEDNGAMVIPDILFLNPGGIYLTKEEADFYAYKLAADIKVIMLPGTYQGVQITP